jgi:nucleoside-diphosphate-sugar epimerase
MRVLFTGHKGFLGKELIPKISEKYQIVSYDGDLSDYTKLALFVESNSITKVIHAAAKIDVTSEINGAELLTKNIEMINNLIKLDLPILTFCSGKIYGYQNGIQNAKENETFVYPEDYYGQSKFIIKKLVENNSNFTILRFFNVFGYYESSKRFIKSNLLRYANQMPMIVNQDLEFDTFYVEDSLPIIESWLSKTLNCKEANLVYKNKLKLTDICEMINKLEKYKVEIIVTNNNLGNSYSGNGDRFSELDYELLGLEQGLSIVYSKIKSDIV